MGEQTLGRPVGAKLEEIVMEAVQRCDGEGVGPDHLLMAIAAVPGNLALHYLRRLHVELPPAQDVPEAHSGDSASTGQGNVPEARTGAYGATRPGAYGVLVRAGELTPQDVPVHEGYLLLALLDMGYNALSARLPKPAQRQWIEAALRNDAAYMAAQPKGKGSLEELLGLLRGQGDDSLDESFLASLLHHARQEPEARAEAHEEGASDDRDDDAELPHGSPEDWLRDLTALARDGQLDPLVGRRGALERLEQALCRRNKRGAVVVGAPGVGKTALLHGLAQALALGQVPPALQGLRLLELDPTALVAGTRYRGELEARVNQLGKALAQDDRAILCIEALDRAAAQGAGQEASDTGTLLASLLSQAPRLRLLATAGGGGKKTNLFAQLGLDNRLTTIALPSATKDETFDIITAIKPRYEDFHNVSYSDEAIKACIALAHRYLTNRQLPDSAIDVLDESGAHAALFLRKPTLRMQVLQALIQKNESYQLPSAVTGNKKSRAARQKQLQQLQNELNKEQEHWLKQQAKIRIPIDAERVAQVVSDMSGIPVEQVKKNEQDRLLNMSQTLQKRIIGQQDAIDAVTRAIQRSRIGLRDPKRPIGALLFLGPTGVGKTLLAKALAEFLFDSEENFIRLDMGEYTEAASVSRLLGASPGYVGYEQGGQLTEQVYMHPYSVVLFDEIEKAAPVIYSTLLQLLDDGRLTDSQGRLIDFKNTLIIMTSNVGSQQLAEFGGGVGYSTSSQRSHSDANRQHIIDKALQRQFAPEFLNRIDEVIHFRTLERHDLEQIIDLELGFIGQRLAPRNVSFRLTPAARDRVLELSFDEKYGARPLRRTLQLQVEDVLTDYLLHHLEAQELACLLDLAPNGNLFVKETKSINSTARPRAMLHDS